MISDFKMYKVTKDYKDYSKEQLIQELYIANSAWSKTIEMAYRRGFHHCFTYMDIKLSHLFDEKLNQKMTEFESKIFDWRFEDHKGTQTPHPKM